MININTQDDVLRERYIYGADLIGEYDLPVIQHCGARPTGEETSVPFDEITKCKKPKEAICHFFLHDRKFERLWTDSERYIPILKNFKYVLSPDFSAWATMPKALQIYNVYRSRALHHWMWLNDINVIPTVIWSNPASFEWCFEGLPPFSTLAVSTNGCHHDKEGYRLGFHEMCERLHPAKVLVFGSDIETDDNVEKIIYESKWQQRNKQLKLEGKR